MKDLTKYFIGLSKLSEDQIKELPQIVRNAGEKVEKLSLDKHHLSWWCNFHKPEYADYWTVGTSNSTPEKQELTYPEFIKLFEGGEGEVLQVENDYQDLKESHSELFRRLNQLRNRYKLDNLDKCLCRAKEINRKYANNEDFKIIQSDKNNVFFLDDCIFTYCPTPNECKNGGCLSKSNNQ